MKTAAVAGAALSAVAAGSAQAHVDGCRREGDEEGARSAGGRLRVATPVVLRQTDRQTDRQTPQAKGEMQSVTRVQIS